MILTLAGVSGYAVDLSRLPQGGVLYSEHDGAVSQSTADRRMFSGSKSVYSDLQGGRRWIKFLDSGHETLKSQSHGV